MDKSTKDRLILLMYRSSFVIVLISISILASIAYVTTTKEILSRIIIGGVLFGISLTQIHLYKKYKGY